MDIDEGIGDDEGVDQYSALVQEQLALVGEDPSREGLQRTDPELKYVGFRIPDLPLR